ncbi:MAG: PHB depolymerase family esterase [Polyangiaceae bacterium]
MNSSARRAARPLLVLFVGGAALLLTHCDNGNLRPPVSMAGGSTGAAGSTGSESPSCPAVKSDPSPPVLDCSFAASGADPSVDNFDDGNLLLQPLEQRVGMWYSFTDETTGCAKLSVERAESASALHLSGGGFSKWGAGFGVSLAWSNARSGLCTYDASAYSGVRFRARGNAIIRLNFATRESAFQSAGGDCPDSEGCFDQPGRNISLSADFQQFEIPFCSLAQAGFGAPSGPLDQTMITNLNFLVQTKSNFDVWLDDLEFIPWQDGQSRDCRAVCPMEELALGIVPRPGESSIDQQATGVHLSTFEQPTKDCGSVTRRYLSYVPRSLAPGSGAPVVILLHGLGAEAESMRGFITQGRFETLAERDGFIVVYGNAAPGVGTVAERPNGGGFRKDPNGQSQVDDFAYLQSILDDLVAHGAISGKNPVFLAGLSDGGGMTHMAALHDPTRYKGIAELMPYSGTTVTMPPTSGGFLLRRVLLGYSLTDPGLPAGSAAQLAPLGMAWAKALGLSPEEQNSPQRVALPNVVKEGADYQGTLPNVLLTRNSQAEQIDYGGDPAGAQVRVLRFDHAGHLWPVPNPPDREQEIAEFGLRNQDLDMSDLVWEFFRSAP